jgi:hypothetical protein
MRASLANPSERRRHRQGFALVAALMLLALSAALLIIAVVIAGAQLRAARSERAALDVDARARHALASVLAGWDGGPDSLADGASMDRALSLAERGGDDGGMPSSGTLRIQHVGGGLYAVAVDVSIGTAPTVARERLRLLVRRPPIVVAIDTSTAGVPGDTGAALMHGRGPPAPIARWSVADLY